MSNISKGLTWSLVQMSACFSSCGTKYEVRVVEWHEQLLLPTAERAAACRRLSELWLLFSSGTPADADLPYKAKECQIWRRAGSAWSALSRVSGRAHLLCVHGCEPACMEANADIRMCTRAQKYWRINSSQASGGGSYANSAALTYSKQVSSLA